MSIEIKRDATDQQVEIRFLDITTGAPETGVAYNTAGIALWYRRDGGAKVAITPADLAALTTTHADGGLKHISDGYCRLDLPDAAVASGATTVLVGGSATGMVVQGAKVSLVANVEADTYARLGAPAGADIAADIAAVDASVDGLGTAGGAAISTDAAGDNYAGGISGVTSGTTKVGTQTNTYTSATALDGTYHTMTHAGNAIDIVYQFLTGGGTSPVSTVWTGYLSSGNDIVTISAWDHVGGAWEGLGSIVGQAGTTNVVRNVPLYSRHRGTSAAELGKVYVRLHCTGQTSPALNTDQIYVSYAVTSRTVGYEGGAVWIDAANGTAGTESFVNGVADNPVTTLADAVTIATALGLTDYHIANGTTITLAATTTYKVFNGNSWILALGGQDVTATKFFNASAGVTGTCTGTFPFFKECSIGTATLPPCALDRCGLASTLTVGSAGDYFIVDCFSQVAGSATPTIDLGAAVGATNISIRRWSGGLTLANVKAGDVVSIDVVSGGTITVGGTGGSVSIRGICSVTDSSGGLVTITQSSVLNRTDIGTTVAAAVWASVVENSKTYAQVLRGVWSILKGKSSGFPSSGAATAVFRDDADSKNRLTFTVDGNGNKTAAAVNDLD